MRYAHCLLLFMSPGYLRSEWCLKELDTFLKYHPQHEERIFVVELDQVAVTEKPEILQRRLGYKFWDQDALSKRTFPLDDDDKAYRNTLLDLAKDIAEQIKSAYAFVETLRHARQATRNNAHDEAIKLWQQVKQVEPQHPDAEEEIVQLQQKLQNQSKAADLMMQLFGRMGEMPAEVFAAVAEVLRDSATHPKGTTIVGYCEAFLSGRLDGNEFADQCNDVLSGKVIVKQNNGLDYHELAKRIRGAASI